LIGSPFLAQIRDSKGSLPIHNAVNRKDANLLVVLELIRRYPIGLKIKDADGNLPLFLACQQPKPNASIIRALCLAYPEAARKKVFGSLALHQLVYKSNPSFEAIKVLLNFNTNAASIPNTFGNLPLHYFCELAE
jgi:ankyrin repeat protein